MENIGSGDVAFGKAYIRSPVDRIEVDDGQIRIFGRGSGFRIIASERICRSTDESMAKRSGR